MKKTVLSLMLLVGLLTPVTAGQTAAFDLFPDKVCTFKNNQGDTSPVCSEAPKQNPVASLLGKVSNIIALIAGMVAVIMIIIAGFQLITSAGNSEAVTKARGKIIGAIIGLLIIAFAWTIIRLVTDYIIK